ncbi:MAG: HAMP domain-containing histidine kinase [Solirubrobacteraceae bacterium]|nr:HAMP domain-containing histidine kinase [Solirubrobacteraceae bacterium]
MSSAERRSIAGSTALFLAALTVSVALIYTQLGHSWVAAYWIAICVGPTSLLALIVAHLVHHDPRGIRSLSQRFWLVTLLALGPVLFAGAAAAKQMFITPEDATVGAGVLVMALAVGARVSYLLSSDVRRDVAELRAGLARVAAGERDVVFRVDGRDELGGLAAQARETVAMLAEEERLRDEAERMRRQTIASISHDLRTPITSLRLLAEAIEDDLVDPETVKRYATSMRTNVEVLGALIDDLFELARIEAGALTWSMEQIELGQIAAEVIGTLEPEASQRGIRIQAPTDDAYELLGDPARLRRVLLNLLQNAVRHTPADGSVTVRIEPAASGGWEVEVADDGEGIDPADADRIFDPFYRGGSEAARTRPGTGLGLAIARAVVEAHGGRIWLAPSERGSRFRFSLAAGA